MSTNRALAETLERMSKLLTLLGADRFRSIAYERAARAIEGLGIDIAQVAKDPNALTAIEGIGKRMAEHVHEFVRTGSIAEERDLSSQVPAGVLSLMELPGVGPKTAALLWHEGGITDLPALQRAIDDGSILSLPRMGAKTVANIKDAIAFSQQAGERLALGLAVPVAERIVQAMGMVAGVESAQYAGSMRRGKETVGDIDILVSTTDAPRCHAAFCAMPGVVKVLASGATKSSVRVRVSGDPATQAEADSPGAVVQADLRTLAPEHFGSALMYFTGSKEHNVRLRELALKKGMTLNEYGLYTESDDPTPPQQRGQKPIASRDEAEVYAALGLPWIAPELREDQGELTGPIPRLIEVADVRAELHAHTRWSDGQMTVEELVSLALARGFHTIAVTDHSKSQVQANGLSADRLRQQRDDIDRARQKFGDSIAILHGCEVDILADGSLDFDDDVLGMLDTVVASPHNALTQKPAEATARLLRAIAHPLVKVLGHPTGRMIGRRKGLEPAIDELAAAAKEHSTALEINAHWLRLDLRDVHVRAAVDAGCLLAINCDIHAPDHADNLRFGITTARRGRLQASACVNCWTRAELGAWLKGSGRSAGGGAGAGEPPARGAQGSSGRPKNSSGRS